MARKRRKKDEDEDPDDLLSEDFEDAPIVEDEDEDAEEEVEEEEVLEIDNMLAMGGATSEYVNFKPAGGVKPAVAYDAPAWLAALTDVYLAVCLDRDDADAFARARCPNMIAHVAWARRSTRVEGARARVLFSRALLAPDMQRTIGNLVGIAAASRADAEALWASEPYTAAGLFAGGGGGAAQLLYAWPRNDHTELNYDLRAYPYAIVAMDANGALPTRRATRPAHLAYLTSLGCVVGAAPLLPLGARGGGGAAGDPVGSVVFVNAESAEAARAIADADPYAAAGVFESVRVYALCDIDVEGTSQARPQTVDPVRDILEREGLTTKDDYPEAYEDAPDLIDV
ncbi:hypothetical protein JKP88DRAFT_275167 [Tribonema minus]|uniref:YCII-related domain-containing protein n=1 Tax=Tribonema minus TaxID=303371 RepID=A0A835ZAP4_9STRA|nr:hypothetical protein JKP88DRAFT_275167 [Tribonema minus]